MKRKACAVGLLVAVAAVVGVAAAMGASERASAPSTTIVLGISPFQDTLLPIVAEKKGWFKQEGLNVKLKTLGWNAIMPTVASGGVDVAINNTTGVVSVANRSPGPPRLVK